MKSIRNIYLLLMGISLILKAGIAFENIRRLQREHKKFKDEQNDRDTKNRNSS